LLSGLLNEPIPGQGVFWSSVGGQAYPVAIRVLSFEKMYSPLDPHYGRAAVSTFAFELRERFRTELNTAAETAGEDAQSSADIDQDALAVYEQRAINALRADRQAMEYMRGDGCFWGRLIGVLEKALPAFQTDRNVRANKLVPRALAEIFGGPENVAWHEVIDGNGKRRVKAGPAMPPTS
jgi:hypothetical protein